MTDLTKITLSSYEQELVVNKEWILTKHIIIDKVYRLFGGLADLMQHIVETDKANLPAKAVTVSPKISRGENYRGLPYVMLDYPRYFTKDEVLAIRTFFWWGNFFSINLHLAGDCKTKAIPALLAAFQRLKEEGYYIAVPDDAWQHHFEADNYLPLSEYTAAAFAGRLNREPFIKIAKKIPLQQWDAAPAFLALHFSEMIQLLKINYPGDETGLLPGTPITGFDL